MFILKYVEEVCSFIPFRQCIFSLVQQSPYLYISPLTQPLLKSRKRTFGTQYYDHHQHLMWLFLVLVLEPFVQIFTPQASSRCWTRWSFRCSHQWYSALNERMISFLRGGAYGFTETFSVSDPFLYLVILSLLFFVGILSSESGGIRCHFSAATLARKCDKRVNPKFGSLEQRKNRNRLKIYQILICN